jgi:hypothetical protein
MNSLEVWWLLGYLLNLSCCAFRISSLYFLECLFRATFCWISDATEFLDRLLRGTYVCTLDCWLAFFWDSCRWGFEKVAVLVKIWLLFRWTRSLSICLLMNIGVGFSHFFTVEVISWLDILHWRELDLLLTNTFFELEPSEYALSFVTEFLLVRRMWVVLLDKSAAPRDYWTCSFDRLLG